MNVGYSICSKLETRNNSQTGLNNSPRSPTTPTAKSPNCKTMGSRISSRINKGTWAGVICLFVDSSWLKNACNQLQKVTCSLRVVFGTSRRGLVVFGRVFDDLVRSFAARTSPPTPRTADRLAARLPEVMVVKLQSESALSSSICVAEIAVWSRTRRRDGLAWEKARVYRVIA